jgi:hypothetical protein
MEIPNIEQQALPGFSTLEEYPVGKRYEAHGKQVKKCGEHYADAVSTEAAYNVANALNAADMQRDWAAMISRMK